MVQVKPTQFQNKAEVEFLEAPPINIQDTLYAEARIRNPSLSDTGSRILSDDGSIPPN